MILVVAEGLSVARAGHGMRLVRVELHGSVSVLGGLAQAILDARSATSLLERSSLSDNMGDAGFEQMTSTV